MKMNILYRVSDAKTHKKGCVFLKKPIRVNGGLTFHHVKEDAAQRILYVIFHLVFPLCWFKTLTFSYCAMATGISAAFTCFVFTYTNLEANF